MKKIYNNFVFLNKIKYLVLSKMMLELLSMGILAIVLNYDFIFKDYFGD